MNKVVEVMARAFAESGYGDSGAMLEARRLAEALRAAGYAVVPREATEGMLHASDPLYLKPSGNLRDVRAQEYRAMIAAAEKEAG